jgi:type II secretory pathway pseudopilin PulG
MKPRHAFTIMEMTVALMMVGVIMMVSMQVATSSMLERLRLAARQAALEHASNVLEAARAEKPDALTGAWAAAHQSVPADTALPEQTQVRVAIQPEAAAPAARRVTVVVGWRFAEDEPEQTVQLTSIFAPRAAAEGPP